MDDIDLDQFCMDYPGNSNSEPAPSDASGQRSTARPMEDDREVPNPVSPTVEPGAEQQQSLQMEVSEEAPSSEHLQVVPRPTDDPDSAGDPDDAGDSDSDRLSDPAGVLVPSPIERGSISPEGVMWPEQLPSMEQVVQQSAGSSAGTSSGSSDVEGRTVHHERLVGGGGTPETPALQKLVHESPEPLTFAQPPSAVPADELDLNNLSMERLQTIARCRNWPLDKSFNLRGWCKQVLDCEPLTKAMSHGLPYGEGDTNVYADQLVRICSRILEDPELFHRAVRKAVEGNIDHILARRSGLDCHFITVENNVADASFPAEIHNLCRYLNNICISDVKPENEATKWVLQAILYQVLSHDKIRAVLCKPLENHSVDIFSLDLSFLWNANETPDGVLLSPTPRVSASVEELRSPRNVSSLRRERSAFKTCKPAEKLKFSNDPSSPEED